MKICGDKTIYFHWSRYWLVTEINTSYTCFLLLLSEKIAISIF